MKKEEIKKLNIGCGHKQLKGFINIDKEPTVKPDIIVDIEKGLPFKNNTFEYIYSYHCLEHVRPQYWAFVLNEIARVAKDKCILELYLPYDNPKTRGHGDHYRTFVFTSFDGFLFKSLRKGDAKRGYYSSLKLVKLSRKSYKLERYFFYLFPFLKNNISFKFKIVKK